MRKIKIIVDSTCDLPKQYLKENDVSVIPLSISFKEEIYKDGVDITVEKLYEYVDKKKMLPKTSALTTYELIQEFKKWVDKDYDVFFISISSSFSCSLQNAYIASQEFDGRVIEFEEKLNYYVPRVRSQFAVETLDYLYKGGRCSSLVFIFGKGLHIRPIIRVTDGKMAVYKKPRGKMIKALNELLQIFKDDLANIELDKVMLTHSLAPESMEYLKQELLKLIPEDKLMITEAGSIVSAHCGKGTIGILYIVK